MSYALPFVFEIGVAGLMDLQAQISDSAGLPVGAPIAAGFIDAGSGYYHWYYGSFPDNFVGFVTVSRAAFPAVTLASAIVTPCCGIPGTNAYAFTYTVTNSTNGAPIDGAEVWITTDIAGANTIWFGYSDAFGVARDVNNNLPFLSPGTYYCWVRLGGYITDAWPDVEVQP